jgi:hypothetical protein
MPSLNNTKEIYRAKQDVELEKIRREKERRRNLLKVVRPPADIENLAFEAIGHLIDCQKNGKLESFQDKETVIEFLLEPGKTNAEKQEEIKALYQKIIEKYGPEIWIPMLYFNSDSHKFYMPHHWQEAGFVYTDGDLDWSTGQKLPKPWRNGLLKGGEGSGKSVAGVVKDLERVRRKMNGILASPDLVHFKKSLWPEFKRWCPWQHVVPDQQRRGAAEWEPDKPFTLTFKNDCQVICGGMDEPEKWEGSNVSWAHLDEARRKKTASALKVINGRIRIPGTNGELPQAWYTTTPKKHWLYAYFGPWEKPGEVDPLARFKLSAYTVTLKTQDNEDAGNLADGYTAERGSSLTPAEARVLLNADWEDIDDIERFLPSMLFWDSCLEPGLKPLDKHRPVVLAADAGIRNDNFALIGITGHQDASRKSQAQIAFSRVWKPRPGKALDFDLIEEEIKTICRLLNVTLIVYDEYQLHQMMTRLKDKRIVETKKFSQQAERAKADKFLLDSITQRQISHDGSHTELREHLDNADRKIAGEDRAIRLVKREDGLKIDAAVSLSMALWAWTENKPAKPVRQQNYLYGDSSTEQGY